MKKIIFTWVITFISIFYCKAQQPVAWINTHAISIDSNKNYLPTLASQLKGNTICGLGEASHGTHEFIKEKSRIVEFLMKRDYKAIDFESSYSVIQRINNYITSGKGDLKEFMKPLKLFDTKEFYDLFQAINAYNNSQAVPNKVTVFGFDIDYIKADNDVSAQTCLDYLARHQSQYIQEKSVIPVLKRIITPGFVNLYEMADEDMIALSKFNKEVNANAQPGDTDYNTFKKCLSLLYQGTLVSNPLARDEFMAENIVNAQQKANVKTVIWSHNVHVAKDTTMAKCKAMGYYLRERYQKQYYTIAFDTFKGTTNSIVEDEFQANSFEMDRASLSDKLAKAKFLNFFITFNDTASNPLYNKAANITNIFSNWGNMRTLQMRPGIDFDAMVFLRETTPSVELK